MGIVDDLNALSAGLAGHRDNISAALIAKGQAGGDFPDFAAQIAAIGSGGGAPTPLGFDGSWNLLFEDDFSGTSLDLTKWRPNWLGGSDTSSTPPVNTAESAAYVPSRVSVTGGNCALSVVSNPITINGRTYPYRSGMIQSFGKFDAAPQAGKPLVMEARINFEAASAGVMANFPAWWSAGDPLGGSVWPTKGEIDIAESLGGNSYGHFHYPGGAPGTSGAPGDDTGWHVWSVKWTWQDKLEFAKDGVVYDTIVPRGTGYQTALSSPHYLILNLAVRSSVGGPDKVPGQMLIDYVRVWRAA